jgi:hypothetical protein
MGMNSSRLCKREHRIILQGVKSDAPCISLEGQLNGVRKWQGQKDLWHVRKTMNGKKTSSLQHGSEAG